MAEGMDPDSDSPASAPEDEGEASYDDVSPLDTAQGNLDAAVQDAADSHEQTTAQLQNMGVPLVAADGTPLDLATTDPETLRQHVNATFDAASDAADAMARQNWSFHEPDYAERAQAMRDNIEQDRGQALDALDGHEAAWQRVQDAQAAVDQAQPEPEENDDEASPEAGDGDNDSQTAPGEEPATNNAAAQPAADPGQGPKSAGNSGAGSSPAQGAKEAKPGKPNIMVVLYNSAAPGGKFLASGDQFAAAGKSIAIDSGGIAIDIAQPDWLDRMNSALAQAGYPDKIDMMIIDHGKSGTQQFGNNHKIETASDPILADLLKGRNVDNLWLLGCDTGEGPGLQMGIRDRYDVNVISSRDFWRYEMPAEKENDNAFVIPGTTGRLPWSAKIFNDFLDGNKLKYGVWQTGHKR